MTPDEIHAKETELFNYKGDDKVVSFYMYRKQLTDTPAPKVQLDSGLPCISHHIKEFVGGELVVISGPTGNGKTLLAQTFTKNFSDAKKWGLWFTYEVGGPQFLEQFGVDLPHAYLPQELTESSLNWIKDRIWEAKLKFQAEYVVIDHLHYLVPMTGISNMSLLIGGLVRELKKFAVQMNMTIFLLAHMTKASPDQEPDVNSCRDSSFVSQEADTLLFVWRRLQTDSGAIVKIAKNRRYGVMGKKVYLLKEGDFFIDDTIENMRDE
jgi:replicative DNA helicase